MNEKPPGKLKWQLILFLARRLPDCKQMTRTFSASLDRDLTLHERIVSKLHLFTCEACRRYLEQIRFVRDAVMNGGIPELAAETSPASLSLEAKERLKKALTDEL
jgi:hypothetical protein